MVKMVHLSLLLLVVTVFPAGAFGHAGVHEEIGRITRLIEQDPANAQWYLQRGDLYRIHQDWSHALADFREAQRRGTVSAGAELGLGRTWLDQESPRQAITHLNRALARQSGDVRARVTRAKAYRVLGKPLAAAADYSRAIEQFSEPAKPLPEYYLERARAYAAAGDLHIGKALQGLDEGVQVLGNVRTLALYAVALERGRGNFDAALMRLDPILAGATRKEYLLFERGEILVAASRYREARQDFLAAQAAIATLPPSRGATRSIRKLQVDIDAHLKNLGQRNDDVQ